MWDCENASIAKEFIGHESEITSLSISQDGLLLASAS